MNKTDDKNTIPSFPEPYKFLNEELAPHFKRFHELEDLRKTSNRNLMQPRDLKPAFSPPEYSMGSPSNNPYKNSSRIDVELEKLDSFLTQKIEGLIKEHELDAALSKQIRETLLEKKYPNQFRDKTPKEIEYLRTTSKDIETSAQFLLEERRRYKEKDKLKETKKEVSRNEVNQETANQHVQLVTSKFMQSLAYTKNKDTALEKIHTYTKNKDLTKE